MKPLLWGALALTLLVGCELPMVAQLNNPLDAKAPGYTGSSAANLEVVYYAYSAGGGGGGGAKYGTVTLDTKTGQLGSLNTSIDADVDAGFDLTVDRAGRAAFAQSTAMSGIDLFTIRKSDGALQKVSPVSGRWHPNGGVGAFDSVIDPKSGRFVVTSEPVGGPSGVTIGMTAIVPGTLLTADASDESTSIGTSLQSNRIVLNSLGTFGLVYSDLSVTEVTAFSIPSVVSTPTQLGTGTVTATTSFPTAYAEPLGRFVYAFSSTGEAVVARSNADPYLFDLTDDSGGSGGPLVPPSPNGQVLFEPTGTYAFVANSNAPRDIIAFKINASGQLDYWTKTAGSSISGSNLRLASTKFTSDGKLLFDVAGSAPSASTVYKYAIDNNGTWSAVSNVPFPNASISYTNAWDPKPDPSGKYVVGFYTSAGATWLSCHDISTGVEKSRVNVITTLSTPAGTPLFTIAEIAP